MRARQHMNKLIEMVDRRKSPDFTQITGYVKKQIAAEFRGLCAKYDLSHSDVIEELVEQWVQKVATHPPEEIKSKSLSNQEAERQWYNAATIYEVVALNMTELRKAGVKNLRAIAGGKIIPGEDDFLLIASTLGLDEKTRNLIWLNTVKKVNLARNKGES